jgi:hypothetical protein
MKFKGLLATALVMALATPAIAADDKAQDQSAAQDVKEKKICRTETVTGSLVAKRRTCMTKAQWDELAANTRKTMGDMTRHQGIGNESGSASGATNNAGMGF